MQQTFYKLLIIDDDEDDFFITSSLLEDIPESRFDIHWAKNFQEGITQLREGQYDACLLDFLLGSKTGLDVLQTVQHSNLDTPIILLTGQGDRDIDKKAMELGATDYLVKSDLQTTDLERCLRYAITHARHVRAIRNTEQLYRTLFSTTQNVVYHVHQKDLRFAFVNYRAPEVFGYTEAEFLNQLHFIDLFSTEADKKLVRDFIASNETALNEWEIMLLTKDGRTLKCLLSIVKHTDNYHQSILHGLITDLSYLMQAEQDRLIAEKMAANTRFTRALGHEIRNPLTNIDLSVEQLELEYEGAEWLEYIDIIKRNSKRIGTLITELLHNSSPLHLEFTPHRLESIMDEAIALVNDRLLLKNITLEKKYAAPSGSTCLLAPEPFKLALLNILVNASEAIDHPQGKISLQLNKEDDFYVIRVTDNGCGIATEQLTKIFEPYVTTKQKGTGLGLITTLNVIKAHKGTIRVNSTLGVGTEFTILLPFQN